jgi:ATP-dependent DNA helicase RecG
MPHLHTQPEGKTLEFKRNTSSPKNWLKTVVAFANSAGGRLVFGVADDQTVQGVDSPLDEQERVCNLIADCISPRLVPNIQFIPTEKKTLLVVEVFPSNLRPHYIVSEGAETGVYVRLGSTNRQADIELISELKRSVEGKRFDEMPMPELQEADLDLEEATEWFGKERKLTPAELRTLHLLVEHQGKWVPSKGAILLFGRERTRHFPDAWVQCGRFHGNQKLDIFDHNEIYCTLPKSIEQTMLFLKKHAYRGADLSEVRRKDVWSIPLEILREVIINAFVHADYSQRGGPIRISFMDDRIEIENPGILLPGLKVEDIRNGTSRIRNNVIARVFREIRLIEQWGTGVRRIFTEAESLGLPEPRIEEIGMRLRFTVFFKEPIHVSRPNPGTDERGAAPTQSPTQSADPVNLLLSHLAKGPASAGELRDRLGLKHRPTFRENYLHPALNSGFIEYTIPDKPSSRLQKYRLTPKGAKHLEACS